MAQVIKIKYENTLRRVTLPKSDRDEELSFAQLEARIRELFKIPVAGELAVTYTDKENDVITMASDQDLQDAVVYQSLNPLRLFVTLVKPKSTPGPSFSAVEERVAAAPTQVCQMLASQLASAGIASPSTVDKAPFHEAPKWSSVPYAAPSGFPTAPGALVMSKKNGTAGLESAIHHGITCDICGVNPIVGDRWKSTIKYNYDLCPTCYDNHGNAMWYARIRQPTLHPHHFHGQHRPAHSAASVFASVSRPEAMLEKDESPSGTMSHHGVSCDVCGVSPIVGNRWKSNTKNNYDLCPSCFEKHGNEMEYKKIDEPVNRPRHFDGPHRMSRRSPACGPAFTHMGPPFRGARSFGMWGPSGGGRHQCNPWMGHSFNEGGRLDARFVCDVTMSDGTEVAPRTHFTKVWRLRNSGSLPWPAHTSLVHVAGDNLGHVSSVSVQMPEGGLAPDAEIDVSVDLVSPEKPGRYIAHWRLASPTGPRFGHRIWVHVQVVPRETLDQSTSFVDDAPQRELVATSESTERGEVCKEFYVADVTGLIFEVPIESEGHGDNFSSFKTEVDNREATIQGPVSAAAVKLEGESIVHVGPKEIGGAKDEGAQILSSSAEEVGGSITYPVNDTKPSVQGSRLLASSAEEVEGALMYPVVGVKPFVQDGERVALEANLLTAKALLDKLEAMGFADVKLNTELLEKNDLDLRKTLDDLCAAEDWDPILEELEEMGFYDTEMNRRLMFKNKGSVKLVVKELVQMTKEICF